MGLFLILVLLSSGVGLAVQPPSYKHPVNLEKFLKTPVTTTLTITRKNIPFETIANQLPNRLAWERFFSTYGNDFYIFIDSRSGNPSNVIGPIPIIPGTGYKNSITLEDISQKLHEDVEHITPEVVEKVVRSFLLSISDILGLQPEELGPATIGHPDDYLWEFIFRRSYKNIPVRDSIISGAINHGNIVMFGTENWGDINLDPEPKISAEEALRIMYYYIDGKRPGDTLWSKPKLEIVPFSSTKENAHLYYQGPIGQGYEYRLVWVIGFQRASLTGRWEVMVDAHDGTLRAFRDLNQYAQKQIVGGVFPVSNDGIAPDGVEQAGYSMPWADLSIGGATNRAGVYNYTSGNVCTTLAGTYVAINDNCGTINECSTTGDIDLGTSGGTDCTVPTGHSAGDTHSARSGFYELNRIKETARGWLPGNTWLQGQLTANMNINSTCNAFWNGTTVNFYRSGGGCRNTGEIAAIFDHEWGHGMDDNDTNGSISSPGEAVADMYAAMRLRTSCIGRGFFWTLDRGCGQDSQGTGFNCSGYGDCCIDCTGVREIDFARHASGNPHTPQNFIGPNCSNGGFLCGILYCCGPCANECHCEGMIPAETGWDLAARDFQSAPFNFSPETAFIATEHLVYAGSGSITDWYTCSGDGASSDGCATNNGYMRWLSADDDNGNLNDGTPHMSAIYNAFNRHGIACSTPAVQNSGCAGGPTTAPTLQASPGNYQVTLSWNAVNGASQYHVFRGEGVNGCNFGKARIASVTGTTFTDSEVANGTTYYYTVLPVGSTNACFGPASNCVSVTPTAVSSPGEAVQLVIQKSGTAPNYNLVFSWNPPTAPCVSSDYALYKGDLTTLSGGTYNHDTQLTCTTGGSTTFSISINDAKIGASDYYIVTPLNSANEGSYGKQSDGTTERPVSANACKPQNISAC